MPELKLILFQLKCTTKQRENITAVPVTTFSGAQLCIYPLSGDDRGNVCCIWYFHGMAAEIKTLGYEIY